MEGKEREEAEVDGEDGRVLSQSLTRQRATRTRLGLGYLDPAEDAERTFGFASNRSQTSKKCFANTSSDIGSPFILILSLTAQRCGDV